MTWLPIIRITQERDPIGVMVVVIRTKVVETKMVTEAKVVEVEVTTITGHNANFCGKIGHAIIKVYYKFD